MAIPYVDLSRGVPFQPATAPVPAPAGTPSPAVVTPPPSPRWQIALLELVVLATLVLGGYAWTHRVPPAPPGPSPTEGVKLGKAFTPQLAAALAAGFEALARDVEAGLPVSAADADLKKVFQDERNRVWAASVSPAFVAVLPDHTEPRDDAQRKVYAQLARDFARGLRGGK